MRAEGQYDIASVYTYRAMFLFQLKDYPLHSFVCICMFVFFPTGCIRQYLVIIHVPMFATTSLCHQVLPYLLWYTFLSHIKFIRHYFITIAVPSKAFEVSKKYFAMIFLVFAYCFQKCLRYHSSFLLRLKGLFRLSGDRTDLR